MPLKMVGKKVLWSRVFNNYFHRHLPMVWLMCCRAKSKHKSPLACKTDGGNQLLLKLLFKISKSFNNSTIGNKTEIFHCGKCCSWCWSIWRGSQCCFDRIHEDSERQSKAWSSGKEEIVQLTFTVTDIFMTMICSSWYQE